MLDLRRLRIRARASRSLACRSSLAWPRQDPVRSRRQPASPAQDFLAMADVFRTVTGQIDSPLAARYLAAHRRLDGRRAPSEVDALPSTVDGRGQEALRATAGGPKATRSERSPRGYDCFSGLSRTHRVVSPPSDRGSAVSWGGGPFAGSSSSLSPCDDSSPTTSARPNHLSSGSMTCSSSSPLPHSAEGVVWK